MSLVSTMAECMGRFGCAYLLCFNLIIGLNLQVSVNGIDYLVAISDLPGGNSKIRGTAEATEGWMQVKTSRLSVRPFDSASFAIDATINGVENKSVVVSASYTVTISGRTSYSRFYILPISALGTRYIVSSCDPSKEYSSVLVIATHSQKTDVDITFRVEGNVIHDGRTYSDGDTLAVSLGEYQTLTLRSSSDISGTIVSSASSVAVFSGTWYKYECVCQTQLLPVERYGQEYVVAVDDDIFRCELQIISEYNDTVITFNNGSTYTVGDNGVYRRTLGRNESLYFNTTRPVMATLCRDKRYISAFVVLSPLYAFMNQAVGLPASGFKKILIEKNANEVDLKLPKLGLTFPVEWENIPGANFKVGTFSSYGYKIPISLNTNFSILEYARHYIVNPGITYYKELESTTSTASSRSTTPATLTTTLEASHTPERTIMTDEADTASSRPQTPSTFTTTSEANHTPEKTTTRTTDEAETESDLLLITPVVCIVCFVITLAFVISLTVLNCYLRRRIVSMEKASTQLQCQNSFDQPVSSGNTRINRTSTGYSSDSTYLTIVDYYGDGD